MLVISRKKGESILIADNIKIDIISIGNDKVTIGIDAPKDIKIVREELLETIETNVMSAKKPANKDLGEIANLIKNRK